MARSIKIITLLLIITFLLGSAVSIAKTEKQEPALLLSPQQLKEDTDYFFQTIEETHPDIYFKLSKEDYEYYKNLCYSRINKSMTTENFYKILAEFLNKFGDGHTNVYCPAKQSQKDLMPPFLTSWIDGHLVITRVFGNFSIKKGDIILYVNNISAQEHLDSIIKYRSFNDYHWARKSAAGWRFLDNFASEPKHELIISSVDNKVFKWNCPLFDENDSEIFGDYYTSSTAQKPFEFFFWEDLNTGYLDWDRFDDRQCYREKKYLKGEKVDPVEMNKIPDFSEMLEKAFKQLNSSNSKYLVVDIRGNGGGHSTLASQLLNYITDQELKNYKVTLKLSKLYKEKWGKDDFSKYLLSKFPLGTLIDPTTYDKLGEKYSKIHKKDKTQKEWEDFFVFPKIKKHFQGKLIILIDNFVFSSAELLAVKCRDDNLGIFIGEPTGGGVTVPGDILGFTLPNSKINAYVSCKLFIRPDESRINERAIYPDYYVFQTREDLIKGRDTVLEFVKNMIKEDKF